MPSGARKRKAAKKKMKNGETHNNSSSSNSSSTHSHGGEDLRSLDDRESDSGEIEREEEARIVDYDEGSGTNGKGLSEEITGNTREENYEKNGSRVLDVTEDTPTVILTSEDKEVAVEEVKPVDAGKEELKAVDVNSVVDTNHGYEIPKQNAIAVEGASVELVKDVVSLPQEINVGFGNSVTSDLAESGLMKNADLALPISDEKERFSSISDDLKSEKVESKIVSKDEDNKFSVAPPVDPNPKSGLNAVKTLETSNALAVTTTQVVDNVKEISTQKRSMDQTSTGSNPLPVQRTSMMGCCGLFELFSGTNR